MKHSLPLTRESTDNDKTTFYLPCISLKSSPHSMLRPRLPLLKLSAIFSCSIFKEAARGKGGVYTMFLLAKEVVEGWSCLLAGG